MIATFYAKGSLLNYNLYWDTVYISRGQILYYQNNICDKDKNIKRVLQKSWNCFQPLEEE